MGHYRLHGMGNVDVTSSPLGLIRGFLAERRDPVPFYRALAARTIAELPYPLAGRRVLDLGCGTGWFSAALREAGAEVVGLDLDLDDVRQARSNGQAVLHADGRCMPFADDTFDGVLCSNLLEHTPDPGLILADCARVTRPGGWIYMSWTVWFGPWGGHAIAPFHYLGPRLGLRAYTAVKGPPTGKNLPFERLWPTHVGQVLAEVEACDSVELRDAHPRYWPSQRWLLSVPIMREVFTWNCVLHLRKVEKEVAS